MPNSLDATGIQTLTQSELVSYFTLNYQTIYGADIVLTSDSPDGQNMMILIQVILDLEDLLTQIYNSFDPDNAIGVTLDQRVAINGIQRQEATYSTTNVTIVTSQSVNLYGQDQTAQPVYTVADNAGNQWQLVTTQTGLGPTTSILLFQAVTPGAILSVPNTITIPITIVLGVSSINNPSTYLTIGLNEETDAALKIRRQQSVSLASQGYLAGLLAALENISGVTFAYVEENTGSTTNADGVPGHSIWVIVAGTGAVADIAQAIYTKRNAGCGMYGSISYVITQVDGSEFEVFWDGVTPIEIYIRIQVESLDGINPPDIAAIQAGLPLSFVPGVGEKLNFNQVATQVQIIDPNAFVSSTNPFELLSVFSLDNGSYDSTLTPDTKAIQFVVTEAKVIILPVTIIPSAVSVFHGGGTYQFTVVGGHNGGVWSMDSGLGSIDPDTGLYTSAGVGSDVVRFDGPYPPAFATVTVI